MLFLLFLYLFCPLLDKRAIELHEGVGLIGVHSVAKYHKENLLRRYTCRGGIEESRGTLEMHLVSMCNVVIQSPSRKHLIEYLKRTRPTHFLLLERCASVGSHHTRIYYQLFLLIEEDFSFELAFQTEPPNIRCCAIKPQMEGC